jgi:hypothetical protein
MTKPLMRTPVPGYSRRYNSRGFLIVEADRWCDPAHDAEWERRVRPKYTERAWRREQMRDWSISSGESFYPEFSSIRNVCIRPIPALPTGSTIVRGWDFGFKHPAVVWVVASPNGHVGILREIMPSNINSHNFRDLVRYLSGQLDLSDLYQMKRDRAIEIVDQITSSKRWRYPKPPWFEPGMKFVDYAGHEALQTRSIEGEAKERNEVEVLRAGGINLHALATRISAREYVWRRLMMVWEDGMPGMFIDPSCTLLIEGLGGGIVYPEATPGNPEPTDPKKDGFYEHLHEAAGYALINIVRVSENAPAEPARRSWSGRLAVQQEAHEAGWGVARW